MNSYDQISFDIILLNKNDSINIGILITLTDYLIYSI